MNIHNKQNVVIFDCDGVMFDSRRANINFYNHILANFGLPPMTPEKIAFVHMHTAEDSINHIFKDTPYLEQAHEYRRNVDYSPFIEDMIIEPGLKTLLRKLKPEFGLAVATNRSNTIGKVIELSGLEGFFDIIVSSLDVTRPKPDPESVTRILDFFNANPRKTFYIGDSLLDQQTARSSGVIFIAYKNRGLDADHHVSRMMEILEVVRG